MGDRAVRTKRLQPGPTEKSPPLSVSLWDGTFSHPARKKEGTAPRSQSAAVTMLPLPATLANPLCLLPPG